MLEDERGMTDDVWSALVELGWAGLLVPEAQGGLGLGLVDVVVLMEEMGRVPFPGPFLSSAVIATLAARKLGPTEKLEALAEGTTRGSVALEENGHGDVVDRVRSRASRKSGRWRVSGSKSVSSGGALLTDPDGVRWVLPGDWARVEDDGTVQLIPTRKVDYVWARDRAERAEVTARIRYGSS